MATVSRCSAATTRPKRTKGANVTNLTKALESDDLVKLYEAYQNGHLTAKEVESDLWHIAYKYDIEVSTMGEYLTATYQHITG